MVYEMLFEWALESRHESSRKKDVYNVIRRTPSTTDEQVELGDSRSPQTYVPASACWKLVAPRHGVPGKIPTGGCVEPVWPIGVDEARRGLVVVGAGLQAVEVPGRVPPARTSSTYRRIDRYRRARHTESLTSLKLLADSPPTQINARLEARVC